MTKITLTLIAGTAALALSVPSFAQDTAAGRPGPAADLTRAAVQAQTQAAFARMDANSDGKIDAADRAARQKAMFDRVDTDKNGQISPSEFTAKRERPQGDQAQRGARGGSDGQRMARSGGMRGPKGMPGGMRGAMAGRAMGMGQKVDANSDGTLTLAEFQAAALARFDAVDADKNGVVTAAERKAQMDSMRQQWQQRRAQPAS